MYMLFVLLNSLFFLHSYHLYISCVLVLKIPNNTILGYSGRDALQRRHCRALELIDEAMKEDSCYQSEMLRSVHVALLCAQLCPEDRPIMSFVVLMLGNEIASA